MRWIFFLMPFFCFSQAIFLGGNKVPLRSGSVRLQAQNVNVPEQPVLELTTLKAFPSAFGYGESVVGGRGQTKYFVINTNNSGDGSLRQALLDADANGGGVILFRVGGTITLTAPIDISGVSNISIIGQTAPGMGIQVVGDYLEWTNSSQVIIRHITWRSNSGVSGTTDCWSFFNTSNLYIDHCSLSYGFDEVLSARTNTTGNVTIANTLLGEAIPSHNRGGIMGSVDVSPPIETASGDATAARNLFYNISARFWNWADNGTDVGEMYNNVIANWFGRLTRTNGEVNLDWYNNYGYAGNVVKYTAAIGSTAGAGTAVNKFGYLSGIEGTASNIYTRGNYIEGFEETPDTDDSELWEYFYNSTPYDAGDPVDASQFTSTRNATSNYPYTGLLSAQDAFTSVLSEVGHTRGTNANGDGVFFRDALDQSYITKIQTNTTESTYRAQTSWTYPTYTGGTAFTDVDNDGIADAFETTHGITDPAGVKVNWDFGSFLLVNTAGYRNDEIYWEYITGKLHRMAGL